MIDVHVVGARGRLGAAVISSVVRGEGVRLVSALVRPDDEARGVPVPGAPDVSYAAEPSPATRGVVVGCTTADEAGRAIDLAGAIEASLVMATTALDAACERAIDLLAAKQAVVAAPNLSLGVSVLCRLVRDAARALADSDVEIVEMHHRHKKDAPSGTAERIMGVIEDVRGALVRRDGRFGAGSARSDREIGLHAVRGGDVVGDHHVIFAGEGERVEIVHRATSRDAFGAGAVRAVRFAHAAPPGRYGMDDVVDALSR